jgi:glucose-6-phosphate isomerase
MISILTKNILAKSIGVSNGIAEQKLASFCEKHDEKVRYVFKHKTKPGYAFTSLPDDAKTLKKIKDYVKAQEKNGWKHIVVMGIGGSALGITAVRDALTSEFDKGVRLHIADNIDPTYTARLLSSLPLTKTLFVVISKSGTTTEPMVLYSLVREKLVKKFAKNYQKHLVFVTDPKEGLLRKIAKEEGIETFDIPPKIGGRFSVLTAVGLLPLALAGIDVTGLLKGAKEMREAIKRFKGLANPALQLAAIQFLMDRKKGKAMTVLMPYSNYLFRVGDWYRQLLAESIGKNKKTGPTPINALGTTDQHSQLQLYNEGPNNKLIIFMKVLKHAEDPKLADDVLPEAIDFLNGKKMSTVIEAAYAGTAESLAKHKRPNLTLEVPKVDAKHIGALFMLFEFQVALLGLLYKVDAFNQPGVELSKKLTKELLKNK